MQDDTNDGNTVELAVEMTIAWLGNANTRASAEEASEFLVRMHAAVGGLAVTPPIVNQADVEEVAQVVPAVTARKSLASPDFIVSMIDGKPYKTLKRHLGRHGMTPEQYRDHFGLKPDYPMVASNYSEARRAMAKKIGLGQKGRKAA